MAPRIYGSSIPPVPMFKRSIFTHILSSGDTDTIGGYPPSHPAFIDSTTGTAITRGQLKQFALAFGYGLLNHPRLLIRPDSDDTVLLFSANNIAYPVVMFGTFAAGLKFSPANCAYTPRELHHQYKNSGSNLIITDDEGLPTVIEMFNSIGMTPSQIDKRIVVINPGLGWAGGVDQAFRPEAKGFVKMDQLLTIGQLKEEVKVGGDDVHRTCLVCYSSGTTGNPKGVETTHSNLTTVLDINRVLPFIHGQDTLLGVLPFSHIYGAVALILTPMRFGVPVVVQKRFDPIAFCDNIQAYRITIAMVVPPILVILTRHPAVDLYDLSSLKYVSSAAAPLGADLIHQVMKRFRAKGTPLAVAQAYGLTETSPVSHALSPGLASEKAGSIGALLPNLEARLVLDSEETDRVVDAAVGEPGELWIRGPTIMKGYLHNPKATAESITQDGWFKTGDICVRDADGIYWIVDRRKELIKYKGFQVPPSELEGVLLTHPDIADAAVIGVEDLKEATELPMAFIVHANSEDVQSQSAKNAFAKSVQRWIETRVASHKYLRGGVSVVNQIPKSPSGKILRRQLRDQAKQAVTEHQAKL